MTIFLTVLVLISNNDEMAYMDEEPDIMVTSQPATAERLQDKGAGGRLQKETAVRLQPSHYKRRSSGKGSVFQVSLCSHLLRPDMDYSNSGLLQEG